MNTKPITSNSRRLPRPYRYSKAARENEKAAQKPADLSFEALLSTAFDIAVDYSNRTFSYLQAAREYEEAVRNDPNTIAYPGTRIVYPGARSLEVELIAEQAGLRYEDVPHLALKLEGTVRQLERHKSVISIKLTLEFAFIIVGRCVNLRMGKRWLAVCFLVTSLLVGPIWVLLYIAHLALKRWLGYI